jgi:tRNA U55 pseudouridine synthase TruB
LEVLGGKRAYSEVKKGSRREIEVKEIKVREIEVFWQVRSCTCLLL